MKTNVKNQKQNFEIVKQNNSEIKESFESVSNDELLKDLENINIESLMQKTALNRSIWKKETLQSYKSEKTARRILRNEQFKLCKMLIHSIITKDSNIENNANNLLNFSRKNLVDIKLYSNVSNELNTEKRNILDKAYQKMFIICKL